MKSVVLVAALLVLSTLPAAATAPGVAATARQPSASPSNRSAASQPASGAPEPAGRSGRQPFITLLCKFADAEDEPISQGYFDGLFGAAYPGLDDWMTTGVRFPTAASAWRGAGRRAGTRCPGPNQLIASRGVGKLHWTSS